MIFTTIGSRKLVRWQVLNVVLLTTGYSGYSFLAGAIALDFGGKHGSGQPPA